MDCAAASTCGRAAVRVAVMVSMMVGSVVSRFCNTFGIACTMPLNSVVAADNISGNIEDRAEQVCKIRLERSEVKFSSDRASAMPLNSCKAAETSPGAREISSDASEFAIEINATIKSGIIAVSMETSDCKISVIVLVNSGTLSWMPEITPDSKPDTAANTCGSKACT